MGKHLKCDLTKRPHIGCVRVGRVGSSEPEKLGRHELKSTFHGRWRPQAFFYSLRDAEVCNLDPPWLWGLRFNKDVLDNTLVRYTVV